MWTYVARRLLAIPPLLLAVSFLTHCLLAAAPVFAFGLGLLGGAA